MSGVFRDPNDGANAKRSDLLRQRRDEFATLPHAVRRVVVTRAARTAACLVACMTGAVFLAATASPELAEWLGTAMPGPNPAVLSMLLLIAWLASVGVYMAARSLTEHRFAVTMSRYVLPTDDLDNDIQRLANQRPDAAAKYMAQRLETRSAALAIAAAAVLWPATAIYLVQAAAALGYPSIIGFEATLVDHSTLFAVIALAGLVVAAGISAFKTRSRATAPVAGCVAAILSAVAAGLFLEGQPASAWLALAPATLAAAAALVSRRLRVERDLVAAADPHAGVQRFSIRRVVRRTRATLTGLRSAFTRANGRRMLAGARRLVTTRPSLRQFLAVSTIAAAVLYGASLFTADTDAVAEQAPVVEHGHGSWFPGIHFETGPRFETRRSDDGAIVVEATFFDATPLEIPALFGLDEIPHGWQAAVQVAIAPGDGLAEAMRPVFVNPLAGDPGVAARQLRAGYDSVTFVAQNCDGDAHPLNLRLAPYGDSWSATGAYRLIVSVQPTLQLADCR